MMGSLLVFGEKENLMGAWKIKTNEEMGKMEFEKCGTSNVPSCFHDSYVFLIVLLDSIISLSGTCYILGVAMCYFLYNSCNE